MTTNTLNPEKDQLPEQPKGISPFSMSAVVEEARAAQPEWSRVPRARRVHILRKFGYSLVDKKIELADLISRENGKPIPEAYTSEIIPALDVVKYYSRESAKIARDRPVHIGIPLMKTKKAFVRYEPYGVVAIISPWNYPLLLPIGQIVPALLTGNVVIFKPSQFTPRVGDFIAQLLWEAGIPQKVFKIIQGAGDVGAELVSSKVDKVFFTGSTATGRKVSQLAARNLTPVSLELGSKDAMIVLDDADIDSATSGAIWGAFMNAGQTCVSVERCFVHSKIYDAFLLSVQQKVVSLRVGSGGEMDNDIGPIIHKAQFDTIKNQVDEAVARGAKIVAGGDSGERGGKYYISPTVMVDLPTDCLLMNEETFGPILPLIKVGSDEEALSLANASRFGLSASIWTANRKRGTEMAKRLQAGAVVLNDVIGYYGISDGVVGGVKESGTGRVHGPEGMHEMVYPKYYEVERARRIKKLWWYRYDRNLLSFFEEATDFLFSASVFRRTKSLFKLAPHFLRIKKI